MTARSVYWQDGMFMWPQHMQQEERFQSERIHLNHQWSLHHNWGLRKLELDPDALKIGRRPPAPGAHARWNPGRGSGGRPAAGS
jgi:predicted component of type VI protein secretion system